MDEVLPANSPPAIQQRIHSGRIGWGGPLALTPARAGLILLVQAGLAAVFLLRGDHSPWRAQAPWWTVDHALAHGFVCLTADAQALRHSKRQWPPAR
jgi:hypothetical protein